MIDRSLAAKAKESTRPLGGWRCYSATTIDFIGPKWRFKVLQRGATWGATEVRDPPPLVEGFDRSRQPRGGKQELQGAAHRSGERVNVLTRNKRNKRNKGRRH